MNNKEYLDLLRDEIVERNALIHHPLWFDLHGEVDKEHGAMSRKVLETVMKTDEDRQVVRYAVRFVLGIKWALFDGVMNAYVNGSYKI